MAETLSKKAFYIGIDGVDGSGKTTQTHMLREHFEASHLNVKVVPFIPIASRPLRDAAVQKYGSESAMRVSFSRSHVEYLHACEQFLNFQEHVAPYLSTHDIIIQDRSKLCRLVNAKYAQTPLDDVEAILAQFPSPDKLFYLKVSPVVALQRVVERGKVGQDETTDYIHRASQYYDEFAPTMNAHPINADQEPEEVHQALVSQISHLAIATS